MSVEQSIHHRQSHRLKDYDYSTEGSYFITLLTKGRVPLFGEIVDDEMVLNDFGRIVVEEWERSAAIRAEIEVDEYVVMPNHFHGIVHIFPENKMNDINRKGDPPGDNSTVGAYDHNPNTGKGDRPVAPTNTLTRPHGPPRKSLGALIGGFKSAVTTRINDIRHTPGISVWQRDFHDQYPTRKNNSGA